MSEDRVGASQTVDYDSLMGNQAILDMLAEGAATSGSMDTASLRLVEGGAVKTLPPDAVPTTQGEDPAESMVEGMAKLNKSKSLAHHDPVKDKVDDPWDVGYRPQMPATPTWDEYHANIDVQGGKVDDGGELFAKSMPRTREVVDMSADEWEYEMEGRRLSWELDSHEMGKQIDASSTSQDALFLDKGLTGKKTPAMALQVWLQGPTIADCQSAMVALMLDALRKKISDEKFNHVCLTSSAKYFITTNPMETPLKDYLENIELYNMDRAAAKRDEETGNWPGLEPGDTVYIMNHPSYNVPDGPWAGENCVYMGVDGEGKQLFAGLGIRACTEEQMCAELAKGYNEDMKTSGMTAAQIMLEGGGLQSSRVIGTGANQRRSAGPEGYRIKA